MLTIHLVGLGPRKSLACVVGLWVLMASAGCSLLPREPKGEILVGYPEVFTRQRLVNRRLTERTWLEGQLANNTPMAQSLQGYRDVRIFSGVYSKTGVTFDPLAGAQTSAQGQLNLQNLQNQSELAALQHKIDVLKLQQQLGAQRNAPLPSSTVATGTSGSSSATPTGGTSPSVSSTPPGTPTPTPSTVFRTPPELPSPADLVETKAKITSVELLRDQLAWRNAVQAALREQELDDSHDLAGSTLYTLKFDISVVVPAGTNEAYAKIQLGQAQPSAHDPNPKVLRTKYDAWLWHLRAAVHLEAIALQRRLELGLLSDEEKVRLGTAIAVWSANAKEPDRYKNLSQALGISEMLRALRPQALVPAKRDAARLVSEKYRVSLKFDENPIVEIPEEPIEITLDREAGYYVPDIETPCDIRGTCAAGIKPDTLAAFHAAASRSRGVTVFVADPKEEAQNISDVAAVEQLRNIVLSLQAALPQSGISASNYTEYMNRSQERLQAILRRPLLVAYSDGREFGWIVGPRFEIGNRGKPRFSQTTVQRSVQVSLIVPGWATKLKIPYRTSWLDKDGKEYAAGKPGDLFVDLPGDDMALTAKLLAETGQRRLPFIAPPMASDNRRQVFRVQAKHPAELLIRGDHLWRNPRVFIGGQEAETVAVLPDMNGLSVRLNSVVMPPNKPKENVIVDLNVVTSEGIATLRDAVQIFPDAAVSTEKFAVSVQSPRVVNADTGSKAPRFALAAPLETVPDGFSRVSIGLRPILPGEDASTLVRQFYPVPGEVTLSRQDQKMVFLIGVSLAELRKSPNPMPGNVGWVMQAEPGIAMVPGASLVPIPSADGKPLLFAFFADEKSSHGALGVLGSPPSQPPRTAFGATNDFTGAVVIGLGEGGVFAQAYPGLKAAIQSSLTIRIAEISNSVEVASTRATLDARHFELAPGRPATDQTPAVIVKSLPGSRAVPAPAGGKSAEQTGPSAWLRQRLSDGQEHSFRLSIIVAPDVEVPIEPEVRIKLP